MVKCERCGVTNEDNYVFCVSCGYRIYGQFISKIDAQIFKKENIEIDHITRERLRVKGSLLASLALSTRALYTRIFYMILIVGFILFLLYVMNALVNTTLLGLVISVVMILIIPKAVGNQIWETERANVLLEYYPSSSRASVYRLITLIRWFYTLGILVILLLLLGGLLKGYW